ncbi:MAG: hypothetical protein ACO3T8_02620, partial [Candidatus Nanopelagicales bacterium]
TRPMQNTSAEAQFESSSSVASSVVASTSVAVVSSAEEAESESVELLQAASNKTRSETPAKIRMRRIY